jgi:hypothetical protein
MRLCGCEELAAAVRWGLAAIAWVWTRRGWSAAGAG